MLPLEDVDDLNRVKLALNLLVIEAEPSNSRLVVDDGAVSSLDLLALNRLKMVLIF